VNLQECIGMAWNRSAAGPLIAFCVRLATHCYRDEFRAAADLGAPAFHLNNTWEIIGNILRNEFSSSDLSVSVMRVCASESLLDLLATSCIWPERITQCRLYQVNYSVVDRRFPSTFRHRCGAP